MKLPNFILFGLSAASAVAQSAPTANILNGTLQGGKCDFTDVNYFFSIPFAKPPIGDLRFASPQTYDQSFSGIRDATQPSPSCLQFTEKFAESANLSEDCLFINVWTPANATTSSNLPVRVWLYGGDNAGGGIANPLYDGCFASTDMIQVSINYRLGPLGFLALESLGLTGNYAVEDQLLGLQWIQENIASFGGDPTKVMLFGQSAGGTASLIISTLQNANLLIRSVILESWANNLLPTLAGAEAVNAAFVQGLNCSLTDLACVRSAPLAAMVTLMTKSVDVLGLIFLGPVVDETVIPVQPVDAGIKVPAVIGSTTSEGTIFVLESYSSRLLELNETDYDAFLFSLFGNVAVQVNQTYPLSDFASSQAPVFSAMSTVFTHYGIRCPARQALRAASQGVPVWTYSFGHVPTCPWYPSLPAQALGLLGATHTSEIPFVMGQVDSLPRPGGECNFTTAEKALSATMLASWRSMAETGSPGGDWPQYATNGSLGVNIGDTFVVGEVDYSMCDFWDNLTAQSGTGNGTSATIFSTSASTVMARSTKTLSVNTNDALAWISAAKSTAGIGVLAVLVALLM